MTDWIDIELDWSFVDVVQGWPLQISHHSNCVSLCQDCEFSSSKYIKFRSGPTKRAYRPLLDLCCSQLQNSHRWWLQLRQTGVVSTFMPLSPQMCCKSNVSPEMKNCRWKGEAYAAPNPNVMMLAHDVVVIVKDTVRFCDESWDRIAQR